MSEPHGVAGEPLPALPEPDRPGDPLPDLVGTVRALAEQPVGEHPEALEQVHRALVDELESLGTGAARG